MTASGGTLLEDRYGTRPRKTSRRTYWILGACAVLLGGVIAWVGYVNLGTAPIETQQVSFENLPNDAMRFTFEVTRDTPERAAVCIVRTRGLNGSEGGRKEVLIPPGPKAVRVTTVIESGDEPVTADVFGCSYQVPAYLSTDLPPSG
ncbi:MAG: DUF4307 domain-containing protein [Actinophytocola sp.]|uniref:DUF4307 domain-containing protein n=1 Tax=Actinophytocola sp. TaxID=1872138 RepID=UPI00132688D1|nr:DUF4307 domain-containing protein [Actinophytocola sp.]MPZ83691.1 DUF4307 domain-containing protein [Actinophytocola sp.]